MTGDNDDQDYVKLNNRRKGYHKLDYLWLDGCTPTQIRYKTKVVKDFGKNEEPPIWGFDGSSTEQEQMVIVLIVF